MSYPAAKRLTLVAMQTPLKIWSPAVVAVGVQNDSAWLMNREKDSKIYVEPLKALLLLRWRNHNLGTQHFYKCLTNACKKVAGSPGSAKDFYQAFTNFSALSGCRNKGDNKTLQQAHKIPKAFSITLRARDSRLLKVFRSGERSIPNCKRKKNYN